MKKMMKKEEEEDGEKERERERDGGRCGDKRRLMQPRNECRVRGATESAIGQKGCLVYVWCGWKCVWCIWVVRRGRGAADDE